MDVNDLLELMQTKAPENTYFDHLYSEFLTVEPPLTSPPAPEVGKKVADLVEKRKAGTLDWNDVYRFELILADLRPASTLRGKVVSLRHDYLSIAGQAEFEEYMASRPKALLDPPDPNAPPPAQANYEKLLREDLKVLLERLYLRYAVLPVREEKLKRLTLKASFWCGLCLAVLILFTIIMLIGRRVSEDKTTWYIPSISIYVVMAAGAMGGFVSALQRIQTSPNQGDSIYNLSMLFHGSYAVFVAPLTGAIFAIMLYLMFTGGILQGRFFPKIYTPSGTTVTLTPPVIITTTLGRVSNTNSAGNTNTAGNTNAAANGNGNINGNANRGARANANAGANAVANANGVTNANGNAANNGNAAVAVGLNNNSADSNANAHAANFNGNAGGSNANAPTAGGATKVGTTPSPTPSPTPPTTQEVATSSIGIRQFLAESGPAGGEDYALLIIWSFIAGFAERFVPDALNRLVAGKQSDGQPGS
ncbi:MAG: hypothetical protein M3444_04745 [Acidobacteriota bacterium]|nr:hypothetical protein [Acidobacteriota bacterium]